MIERDDMPAQITDSPVKTSVHGDSTGNTIGFANDARIGDAKPVAVIIIQYVGFPEGLGKCGQCNQEIPGVFVAGLSQEVGCFSQTV